MVLYKQVKLYANKKIDKKLRSNNIIKNKALYIIKI